MSEFPKFDLSHQICTGVHQAHSCIMITLGPLTFSLLILFPSSLSWDKTECNNQQKYLSHVINNIHFWKKYSLYCFYCCIVFIAICDFEHIFLSLSIQFSFFCFSFNCNMCLEILSNKEDLCEDQSGSFSMGADTCTHKSLLLFLLSPHNSTLIINSYLHSICPTFLSSLSVFFYVLKGESHSQIIGS